MSRAAAPCALIRLYTTVFWDFDGVIKESLAVKADAFERLFAPFGAAVAMRVRSHHEHHGGLSRYEKLPLYLEWAGQESSAAEVARYCELFSAAVCQRVIDCEWVPGAREYLQANYTRQTSMLVTGTPQTEIEGILDALGITHWFREVHGAPVAKADAICSVLARSPRAPAILIGDSASDYAATQAAGIDFLLRRTGFNRELQQAYRGPQCDDFYDA
jgi:phosphoglycolate phosphatase-like HAD superfamily hydrolase